MYNFYKYTIQAVIEGLRERGMKIGKTEYQRGFFLGSRNFQKKLEEIESSDTELSDEELSSLKGTSSMLLAADAEVRAIKGNNITTILVKDELTEKTILETKTRIGSLGSLLRENELVTIGVPSTSGLSPCMFYKLTVEQSNEYLEFQKQFTKSTLFGEAKRDVVMVVVREKGRGIVQFCSPEDMGVLNISDPVFGKSAAFGATVLMYRAASPERFIDGVVSVGGVVQKVSPLGAKVINFSLSDGREVREHYRRAFLRQLMDERYYRGEYSAMTPGSRVVFVSPTVVNQIGDDLKTATE